MKKKKKKNIFPMKYKSWWYTLFPSLSLDTEEFLAFEEELSCPCGLKKIKSFFFQKSRPNKLHLPLNINFFTPSCY